MANSGLSAAKNRVIGFFNTEVSMYILKDIDKLDEIRPDKDGLCACAVPHALMLFSVIDFFGYLTRDDSNPRKEDTYGNFKYLLSEQAGFFPMMYKDNCDKIVKLFRHGLTHQFFPKASGIAKAGGYPLIFQSSGIPNLNVDVLSKDVKEALGKIKESILHSHDDILAERINSRLDKLVIEDYETLSRVA
ncbi:MAG: hypothetical protein ABSC14_01595 [Desulfomonilia bacterium]|jgi:hypothetical protein